MTAGPVPLPPAPTGPGPLAGVRVVEMGGIGPVPFAALLLAEYGADVVRVERPGGASDLAVTGGLSRSRPNVAINVKHPDGLAVARRLIDDADVLIEGQRPGVMEHLGLGPQQCLTTNPGLIYGRMTGWGQHGPWAHKAGHDITYAAISGALHLTGSAQRPTAPVNVLADFGGGSLYLVAGVLAALHARTSTGHGQVIDAAMVDGAASLVTMFYALSAQGQWSQQRGSNPLDGGLPFYDTYACSDNRFVAVGALEPQFYRELLQGLGVSFATEQNDPAGFAEQRQTFTRIFATQTRDEWAEHFEGLEACVAPVLDLTEAPQHPHMDARHVFAHPENGPTPQVAPRFSATPTLTPGGERANGQDTTGYLLGRGFCADEIDRLLASGAAHQSSLAP